jgi:hypothetical protein
MQKKGRGSVMGNPDPLVVYGLVLTVALAAGFSSDFADLAIWGFVALGLAVMSYFGHREKQRRRAEQQRVR